MEKSIKITTIDMSNYSEKEAFLTLFNAGVTARNSTRNIMVL